MKEPSLNSCEPWAFVALIALALSCAEFVARFVVPRISAVEARVAREKADAMTLRHEANGQKSLLLLGNSLLKHSVVKEMIVQDLQPEWKVNRLLVEGTFFPDLYFGLKHLFEEGSRPAAVVMMIAPIQMSTTRLRGTYASYHLFSFTDTIRAGISAGKHATEISGLAIGNFSAYYGLRDELRKFALQIVIPQAELLAPIFAVRAHTEATTLLDDFSARTKKSLTNYAMLCKSYDTRCFLLLAPRPGETSQDAATLLEQGQELGLHTRSLQSTIKWDTLDFESDRFHMQPHGAQRFSTALVPILKAVLTNP